jgi:hypothetical protein
VVGGGGRNSRWRRACCGRGVSPLRCRHHRSATISRRRPEGSFKRQLAPRIFDGGGGGGGYILLRPSDEILSVRGDDHDILSSRARLSVHDLSSPPSMLRRIIDVIPFKRFNIAVNFFVPSPFASKKKKKKKTDIIITRKKHYIL